MTLPLLVVFDLNNFQSMVISFEILNKVNRKHYGFNRVNRRAVKDINAQVIICCGPTLTGGQVT